MSITHKDEKVEVTDTESDVRVGQLVENVDNLQRRLNNRQVQILAIGGSIGTALFVSIGNGLAAGGPGSLLLAYSFYAIIVCCVNNCIAEMIVLQPVSGAFIRVAGQYFDDALGFAVGWNFFFYEACIIPFEVVAVKLVLNFWRDDIPVAAVCSVVIALYGILNVFAVRVFGEAEFWLSSGKIVLIFSLFFFTFITMVGGNPQHEAYGFRNWNTAGAFAPNNGSALDCFEGFLSALWSAAFTIVGPEYVSIAAAETKRPRTYMKRAFKTIYWRFVLFFVGGALCVGIVLPWNNPTLQAILKGESSASGASASPYVIAMQNMGIGVFPHFVTALLITSIFSAGNMVTYCAIRSLYSLALEGKSTPTCVFKRAKFSTGRAPRILAKTTKSGVPIYSFLVVMCFPFLSFLQTANSSAQVINWLVSITTAGALIDYLVICLTYINFHKACKVQGLDRKTLPYYAWFQPYCAWIALVVETVIVIFYGYKVFDGFTVAKFFQNYSMQLVFIVLYLGWKFTKKTRYIRPGELDLVWERPVVDAYEASFVSPPLSFWTEIGQMFGYKRHLKDERVTAFERSPTDANA